VGVWEKIAHLKVTQEMMRDGAYFSSSSLLANHQRSQCLQDTEIYLHCSTLVMLLALSFLSAFLSLVFFTIVQGKAGTIIWQNGFN
jgi:hypothetical protein